MLRTEHLEVSSPCRRLTFRNLLMYRYSVRCAHSQRSPTPYVHIQFRVAFPVLIDRLQAGELTKRNIRAIDNALTRLPTVEAHRKAIELQTIGDHSQPLRPYPRFVASRRTSTTPYRAPPTEAQTNPIALSSPHESPTTSSAASPTEVQTNQTTAGPIVLSPPQVLSDNPTTSSTAPPTEAQTNQTILTIPSAIPFTAPQVLNDSPTTSSTVPPTEAQTNQTIPSAIPSSSPQVLNDSPTTSSTVPPTEAQTNQTIPSAIPFSSPQVLNDGPTTSCSAPPTEVQVYNTTNDLITLSTQTNCPSTPRLNAQSVSTSVSLLFSRSLKNL